MDTKLTLEIEELEERIAPGVMLSAPPTGPGGVGPKVLPAGGPGASAACTGLGIAAAGAGPGNPVLS